MSEDKYGRAKRWRRLTLAGGRLEEGPRMLDDDDYISAGKMLQWWRRTQEVSARDLAERANIYLPLHTQAPDLTIEYVVRYERGRLAPLEEHLRAMERVLGCDDALRELYGFEVTSDPVDPIDALASLAQPVSRHH